MLSMGQGKREKGRPRIRYLDEVQTIMGSTFLMAQGDKVSPKYRNLLPVSLKITPSFS